MHHWLFISVCAVIVIISVVLIALNSPYLGWDYSNPKTAVVGVTFHAFEWLFAKEIKNIISKPTKYLYQSSINVADILTATFAAKRKMPISR